MLHDALHNTSQHDTIIFSKVFIKKLTKTFLIKRYSNVNICASVKPIWARRCEAASWASHSVTLFVQSFWSFALLTTLPDLWFGLPVHFALPTECSFPNLIKVEHQVFVDTFLNQSFNMHSVELHVRVIERQRSLFHRGAQDAPAKAFEKATTPSTFHGKKLCRFGLQSLPQSLGRNLFGIISCFQLLVLTLHPADDLLQSSVPIFYELVCCVFLDSCRKNIMT